MPHKVLPAVAEADTGRCCAKSGIVRRALYSPRRCSPGSNVASSTASRNSIRSTAAESKRCSSSPTRDPRAPKDFDSSRTCLRIAGVLSLAAGLVFFVAANWSEIAVFGRFALIELVLSPARRRLLETAAALSRSRRGVPRLHRHRRVARAVRPDLSDRRRRLRVVPHLGLVRPAARDRRALGRGIRGLGAGAQHGAAAVLRLASHAAACFGSLFGGAHFQPAHLIIGAAWLNLALWFVVRTLRAGGRARLGAAPAAVLRLRLRHLGGRPGVVGVDYCRRNRAAIRLAVLGARGRDGRRRRVYALRRRDDIYPLAVVMGTFIIVSIVWLARRHRLPTTRACSFCWRCGSSALRPSAGKVLDGRSRAAGARRRRHERVRTRARRRCCARAA